jgi:hypothetical protein
MRRNEKPDYLKLIKKVINLLTASRENHDFDTGKKPDIKMSALKE